MNENIFKKATRLAAAWHAKALSIDGLAAEIDRDRDLVEALKGTTLPIATGEDFKFWEDLLFAAGYVRDQILLVLDDGRAVVEVDGRASGHLKEAGGKAIGHRTFLAVDPQVVTTDDTGDAKHVGSLAGANEEVRFQYGAELPESVYVEGDTVFLEFTGRMPAHLYVAGDLSVDRAAANMLPADTLVGNDLHVFEFLSDVGPIRLPDGLLVRGYLRLPDNTAVTFGKGTEVSEDVIGGADILLGHLDGWSYDDLVEAVMNDDPAALMRLKRRFPPTGLDDAVVRNHDIVAFNPTTRRVIVADGHGKCDTHYDELAVNFYGDDIDPWDGADILARNIERYVEIGGTFDGEWDGLDIVPIEGGWRINLLDGPDEGAVIEVVDGKATIMEVEPPTEDEIEQVGLSLTRPHDGGVPI